MGEIGGEDVCTVFNASQVGGRSEGVERRISVISSRSRKLNVSDKFGYSTFKLENVLSVYLQ